MLYPTTLFTLVITFISSACTAKAAFHGDATWYTPGLGSCGRTNRDSDFIVALSLPENSHEHRCWQHIQIHYRGRTVEAMVVDSCPGCSRYSLDLSPAAFRALAPLGVGRIQVTWNYK